MQLATVEIGNSEIVTAIMQDGAWLDLASASSASAAEAREPGCFSSMQALLDAGDSALEHARGLLDAANAGSLDKFCHQAGDGRLLAPFPAPRKNVFCVGRNYAEHIAEGERAQKKTIGVTEHPVFFTKPLTAVIGPHASIPMFPALSESIDYEVELAVIIGKAGLNISRDNAFDHIFGYTIANDVTARDIQRQHGGQYFKGKALDGSCPLGPVIVTADDIADPHKLGIRLSVNNEQRQNGTTADMIFNIPVLIESLSQGLTLQPGDIIATGTPSGVGYAMEPPRFLKDGDVVTCEIDGIGVLQNTVRVVD